MLFQQLFTTEKPHMLVLMYISSFNGSYFWGMFGFCAVFVLFGSGNVIWVCYALENEFLTCE